MGSVSCSRFFISRSNVAFSSLEARRNSVMAFPRVRPSSGNFFGPKRSSARMKINIVSCQPSGPIEFRPPLESFTHDTTRQTVHYREMAASCLFCQIAARDRDAAVVFDDGFALAFLDHRPLFPGHCLLIPKPHIETLADLPADGISPLFAAAL